MADVLKFKPVEIGAGHRLDAGEIVDNARAENFETVVIIGEHSDGKCHVTANANMGETLILMERAKHMLLFDGDDE